MKIRNALLFLALAACAVAAAAQGNTLSKMPVREVTVFKDGHAFVLNEGSLPVSADGSVALDGLPAPVLGTFWPYSAEKGATLRAVVAGQKRVTTHRSPLHLAEFIESNTGAEVIVTEKAVASDKEGLRYAATLVGVPRRSAAEVEAASPPGSGLKLPEKGTVVLLKTADGVKVLPAERILDITLKGEPAKSLDSEELRDGLTLRLDWGGRSPSPEARVGLAYLQRGLRWIPSYRVELDGKGGAAVRLQATLVNDLADLDDVTANLVIGVPSFAFKEELDPMALQRDAAQLSGYMQPNSQTAYAFSNAAVMTQALRPGASYGSDEGNAERGPEITGGEKAEDLFLFTVKRISLRKGERMVLPVAEFAFKVKDVFVLEVPALPPAEMTQQRSLSGREAELAKLLASPKVMHKLRWTNTAREPLTTAPALIFSEGRLLAQGLMTYAAPGAEEELEVTAAVDLTVKRTDAEVRRIPNALTWNGDNYFKVELKGSILLTNHRAEPVNVEVTRKVLGNVDTASEGGVICKLNRLEEGGEGQPTWWSWYSWPYWWNRFNGTGSITWKTTLEPGKHTTMDYTWNYLWR
jgi:hypothetical protein